ncbi:GTP-binding protein Obg [Dissulfuribacter thermophilus]|uniref:GTPase Obg n=1 Tax=Dissulfuribacter thermophilus TaxID=1156395 RepID=A0A1B9F2V8_9BACT|nr:GTPase ObgE [Dissulfuribacter thermophilus]OCC14260.1 GTP-binding protein Obg [Dissulfuribacter thermophilus]
MKFLDEAKIFVKAGDGGPGCVSFRRERYVPRGGPDGGDGGKGGDVVFVVDPSLNTLSEFRRKKRFIAQRGEAGRGKSQHGRAGKDLVVRVPPGTIVKDAETGRILKDLTTPGTRWIAARGGKGGKGNERFKSATRQAPRFAQPGRPGEERWLDLELKLIADVGLVGEPNAGKSTFLSRVTSARPKIADYPFTTIRPMLGVADLTDERTLVIADIPGLIEGAHKGIGMGHQFLKHIERTKVLLIILDLSLGKAAALKSFETLMNELSGYHDSLNRKPLVVALNKIDLLGVSERSECVELCNYFIQKGISCHPISGVTGEGVAQLLETLWLKARGPNPDDLPGCI